MAEGANCSYIDPLTYDSDFLCPACQSKPAVENVVQQNCACRLQACDSCLLDWARARVELDTPLPPSCFQCRGILDLSNLRPQVTTRSAMDHIFERVTGGGTWTGYQMGDQDMLASLHELRSPESIPILQLGYRAPHERRMELSALQPVFISESSVENTIYVHGLVDPEPPADEMILIRVNSDFSNAGADFFVWAHRDLSLGNLEKRLKVQVGWTRFHERISTEWVDWTLYPPNLTIAVSWDVNGHTIDEDAVTMDTPLSQLGLLNGCRLRITYPQLSLGQEN